MHKVIGTVVATEGDQDLIFIIIECIFPFKFIDNGTLQLGSAANRRILGKSGVDRFNGGLFYMLVGVTVRLTRTEPDNVPAFGPQWCCTTCNRERR